MKKIDFETLAEYFAGQLENREAGEVARWVAENSDSVDPKWLRAFTAITEKVKFPVLQAETRRSLIEQFERRKRPQTHMTSSLWQRVVAALAFDSSAHLAPAMRSVQGDTHQLIYRSQPLDLSLDIVSAETAHTINGQLLFNEVEEGVCSIQLVQADAEIALTRADEFGEFVLSDVATGSYELVVNHASYEVVITPFVLGAEESSHR